MIVRINLNDIEEVREELFSYVWNFKHAENVMYNFDILASLYDAQAQSANPELLNKPITISIVSIIEAILIDFLTRINEATNHLPGGVEKAVLDELKASIENDKKQVKIDDAVFGEQILLRRKMYHFNEIVKLLKQFGILGNDQDPIYELLSRFADMRNRVHIENYHGNLEDKECQVFTTRRLQTLENILSEIWQKMCTDFKRPW